MHIKKIISENVIKIENISFDKFNKRELLLHFLENKSKKNHVTFAEPQEEPIQEKEPIQLILILNYKIIIIQRYIMYFEINKKINMNIISKKISRLTVD